MVHTENNEKKKDKKKEVKKKYSRMEFFITNVFLPEERYTKK